MGETEEVRGQPKVKTLTDGGKSYKREKFMDLVLAHRNSLSVEANPYCFLVIGKRFGAHSK